MQSRNRLTYLTTIAASALVGLALGAVAMSSLAENTGPTEHKGLTVESLGIISEESMQAQLGLSGYVLQLRSITIDPGGQIAQHDHATRPGLVKVVSGTWTEGRPEGEMDYAESDGTAILEDSATVHWFWNRGSEPATALVCDIVPAS